VKWLAALALVACSKSAPPAPSVGSAHEPVYKLEAVPIGSDEPAEPKVPAISIDEAGTKVIALMTKMVDAAKASGGDCAKLGAALRALEPDMDAINKHARQFDEDAAQAKAFEEKYGAQIETLIESQQATLESCKDNPDVQTFFSGME
jgi:hypothetical protein